ncbi:hypothetical protein HYH03_013471 [Edaphochlamys debaryana]|uniref:Uncharacterized protein n=1 Tax=Edaphochlamys debaryana TaxID=47281 RepID=A0A835XQK1_9CHLO|nr:hypothetical protein HYH03_013471 [Edaphochlamys debaryana]|eukprot:KAG2487889.1 hypothetical protein HYH03_013471 [Edaphochlamys debaryana]
MRDSSLPPRAESSTIRDDHPRESIGVNLRTASGDLTDADDILAICMGWGSSAPGAASALAASAANHSIDADSSAGPGPSGPAAGPVTSGPRGMLPPFLAQPPRPHPSQPVPPGFGPGPGFNPELQPGVAQNHGPPPGPGPSSTAGFVATTSQPGQAPGPHAWSGPRPQGWPLELPPLPESVMWQLAGAYGGGGEAGPVGLPMPPPPGPVGMGPVPHPGPHGAPFGPPGPPFPPGMAQTVPTEVLLAGTLHAIEMLEAKDTQAMSAAEAAAVPERLQRMKRAHQLLVDRQLQEQEAARLQQYRQKYLGAAVKLAEEDARLAARRAAEQAQGPSDPHHEQARAGPGQGQQGPAQGQPPWAQQGPGAAAPQPGPQPQLPPPLPSRRLQESAAAQAEALGWQHDPPIDPKQPGSARAVSRDAVCPLRSSPGPPPPGLQPPSVARPPGPLRIGDASPPPGLAPPGPLVKAAAGPQVGVAGGGAEQAQTSAGPGQPQPVSQPGPASSGSQRPPPSTPSTSSLPPPQSPPAGPSKASSKGHAASGAGASKVAAAGPSKQDTASGSAQAWAALSAALQRYQEARMAAGAAEGLPDGEVASCSQQLTECAGALRVATEAVAKAQFQGYLSMCSAEDVSAVVARQLRAVQTPGGSSYAASSALERFTLLLRARVATHGPIAALTRCFSERCLPKREADHGMRAPLLGRLMAAVLDAAVCPDLAAELADVFDPSSGSGAAVPGAALERVLGLPALARLAVEIARAVPDVFPPDKERKASAQPDEWWFELKSDVMDAAARGLLGCIATASRGVHGSLQRFLEALEAALRRLAAQPPPPAPPRFRSKSAVPPWAQTWARTAKVLRQLPTWVQGSAPAVGGRAGAGRAGPAPAPGHAEGRGGGAGGSGRAAAEAQRPGPQSSAARGPAAAMAAAAASTEPLPPLPPTHSERASCALLRDALPEELGSGPVADAAAGAVGGHEERRARAAALLSAAAAVAAQLAALPRRPAGQSGPELFATPPDAAAGDASLPARALVLLGAIAQEAAAPYAALAPGAASLWRDPDEFSQALAFSSRYVVQVSPEQQSKRFRQRAAAIEHLAAALYGLYGMDLPLEPPRPPTKGHALGVTMTTLHALALAAVQGSDLISLSQEAVERSGGHRAFAHPRAAAGTSAASAAQLLSLPIIYQLVQAASSPTKRGSLGPLMEHKAGSRTAELAFRHFMLATEVLRALGGGMASAAVAAARSTPDDRGLPSKGLAALVGPHLQHSAEALTNAPAAEPSQASEDLRLDSWLAAPGSRPRKACAEWLLWLSQHAAEGTGAGARAEAGTGTAAGGGGGGGGAAGAGAAGASKPAPSPHPHRAPPPASAAPPAASRPGPAALAPATATATGAMPRGAEPTSVVSTEAEAEAEAVAEAEALFAEPALASAAVADALAVAASAKAPASQLHSAPPGSSRQSATAVAPSQTTAAVPPATAAVPPPTAAVPPPTAPSAPAPALPHLAALAHPAFGGVLRMPAQPVLAPPVQGLALTLAATATVAPAPTAAVAALVAPHALQGAPRPPPAAPTPTIANTASPVPLAAPAAPVQLPFLPPHPGARPLQPTAAAASASASPVPGQSAPLVVPVLGAPGASATAAATGPLASGAAPPPRPLAPHIAAIAEAAAAAAAAAVARRAAAAASAQPQAVDGRPHPAPRPSVPVAPWPEFQPVSMPMTPAPHVPGRKSAGPRRSHPTWLPPPNARDIGLYIALRDAVPEFATGLIADAAAGKASDHDEQEARSAAVYGAAEAMAAQLAALPQRPAEASALELFGREPRASGDESSLPSRALVLLCALIRDAAAPYRILAPGSRNLWKEPHLLGDAIRAGEAAAKAVPELQAERFRQRASAAERLLASLYGLYGMPPPPRPPPGSDAADFGLGPATLQALGLAAVRDAVARSGGPSALATAAAASPPGVLSHMLGLPTLRSLSERSSGPAGLGELLAAFAPSSASSSASAPAVPSYHHVMAAMEILGTLAVGLVDTLHKTVEMLGGGGGIDPELYNEMLGGGGGIDPELFGEVLAAALEEEASKLRTADELPQSPSNLHLRSALGESNSSQRRACGALLTCVTKLAGLDELVAAARPAGGGAGAAGAASGGGGGGSGLTAAGARAGSHGLDGGGGGSGGGGGDLTRRSTDDGGGEETVLGEQNWPSLGAAPAPQWAARAGAGRLPRP